MKKISLFFLTLTPWFLASCNHTAATGATSDAAGGVSNIAADKRPCAEVAKRYIENIMAGNLQAAEKDRAGIRNGHTSEELISMLKPMGPLDRVDFLSVERYTAPDSEHATVLGLMYFKGGKRQHFRCEEMITTPGTWSIVEFAYEN